MEFNPAPQRMTRQRHVVLEALRKMPVHPTADELYLEVRQVLPHISLGTVYRNLDLLCRSGQARRLDWGPGPARFDGDMRAHYHARCTRCGRLEDVPLDAVPAWPAPASTPGGYQVTGCRIELEGVCPACAAGE